MKNRIDTPTKIQTVEEKSLTQFLDYEKSISDKFYKFIINLTKLRDRLNFDIYENYITIYGDINYRKILLKT
jgi:hypothetical protein